MFFNLSVVKKKFRLHFIFPIAQIIILITSIGCIKLGPKYRQPEFNFEIPESYQNQFSDNITREINDKWWDYFEDPRLNELVEEVLANNLDLKKASARIIEVRSGFKQARADRFPKINLQGSGQRQQISIENQTFPSVGGIEIEREYDTYSLTIPASFELDIWGRLSSAEEAAKEALYASEENYLTLAQSLISEIISLYFQVESLERRIQLMEQSIEKYTESYSIVENRYRRGIASILDLKQAKRTLASAESNLPSLRQELGITQYRMSVMLGEIPESSSPRKHPEDYFELLPPVPPGLPSELLMRRPDIRASEANLKALNAQIGVAKASRFPSISLTGMFGYSSSELDMLFTPESELWNAAIGIFQPLFNAGKLKAGQRAAEARYQLGLAEYAKTVLNAFAEVESALLTRKEQLAKREKILIFVEESRIAQEVAENRYERGLLEYLTVLEAQQTRYKAEEYLIMVDYAILVNRINLHRALGSGLTKLDKDKKYNDSQFKGF